MTELTATMMADMALVLARSNCGGIRVLNVRKRTDPVLAEP